MKKLMKKIAPYALSIGLTLGSFLSAKAQTVSGQITDVLNNTNPIFNAYVQLEGLGSDSTDENGYYTIINNGVNNPIYTIPNTLPEKVIIYNNLGQKVNSLENIAENSRWNLDNNSGSPVASGVYFLRFFDEKGKLIATNKTSVLRGDIPVRLSVPNNLAERVSANSNNNGRKICLDEIYNMKISCNGFYDFENMVDVSTGTVDMPIIPTTFDIDFGHEVACHALAPNWTPVHPIRKWEHNPNIYFNSNYPAPDSEFQAIAENAIANYLPNFHNNIINPEIVSAYPDSFRLMISFVPASMLSPNAGGSHTEWLENPQNPNEITRGSILILDTIPDANSRLSILLHELTQCLMNGSDSDKYSTSIFGGYGPSLINYSPIDLEVGDIIYNNYYTSGTWF